MSKAFKLFYDFMSPPSRGLWISLKLGNIPFEPCPVALRKREHLTDEYKKINRFQKVPALVDGNFHLSESLAMLHYLADKGQFSEKLYPKALEDRAVVDEFLEWQQFNIYLSCILFFREAWLLPINGLASKPAADKIEKFIKDVETNLKLLERLWLNKNFLVGDQLTVADLFCATAIEQIKLCQYNVNEKQFPKVAKWLSRVREASNPYYDEAHSFIIKGAAKSVQSKI